MRSLSSAAHLLASAATPTAVDALLATLGFTSPAHPLDLDALHTLGVTDAILSARVARGIGTLRALHIELAPTADPRTTLSHTATRLTRNVPQHLWLLVATQQNSSLIAIAAWPANVATPRVLALIAHYDRIVESDAETLCALAAAPPNDLLRHSHWLDTLGRQAITGRFYRAIEREIGQLASSLTPTVPTTDARTLAILYTSRLLFLSFLQTKGWLNNDFAFLLNGFINCAQSTRNYQRNVLNPLFFGTLNTRPHDRAPRAHAFGKIPFLNGGLFTRTPLERKYRHATFHNDAFATLYDNVFTRYRFTAREDSATWTETAIDPEMLGKVFESLMAPTDRKRSGAFYTPQTIVHSVTHAALTTALCTPHISRDTAQHALAHQPLDTLARGLLLDRTSDITLLDPACGSGAFLVHALESLATLRASLGDPRPVAAIRRALLTTTIHGVDVNPTAVWMCELRLWLSVVIDNTERDPMRVLPLPNLDHQICVGNSLTGGTFTTTIDSSTARQHRLLHQRYARATGQRKKTLNKAIERATRAHTVAYIDRAIQHASALRKEVLCQLRTKDLFTQRPALSPATRRHLATLRADVRRLRTHRDAIQHGAALPFTFAAHFPTVAHAGGFSAIIGNPPWVRLHHIAPPLRRTLRHTFTTFRNAPWSDGAKYAHAGKGFAAQIDLATLFVERAVELLAPNGTLALLLPAKLWRSLSGGGLRHFLATTTRITALEDLSDAPPAFDAAAYPSLLVATRRITPQEESTQSLELPSTTAERPRRRILTPPARFAIHHHSTISQWTAHPNSLPLTRTPDSPWLLIPPRVRTAFDTITNAATPLAHTPLHRPSLGVKSGCNDAFIVHEIDNETERAIHDPGYAVVHNGHARDTIERSVLRPLLRGDAIQPWSVQRSSLRIIWTHDDANRPLRHLPPHTERWLTPWRHQLIHRADVRRALPWWSIFRTNSARPHAPRVIWSDFGRTPRAAFLEAGDPTVPLNTCYVVHTPTRDDAAALTTLLNSPLIAAWLHVLAEPARGGYHRYLAWTMSLLPIPHDWPTARMLLAPIAYHAQLGAPPTHDALLDATIHAFQLSTADVRPLLQWNAR